jgi:septal ring factor EnvC (AmiA/AmiB activator)
VQSLRAQLAASSESLAAAQAEQASLNKSLATREGELKRLGDELKQAR